MLPVDPMPDPSRCPLCGQPNQCAMEVERATGVKQPPCWCNQASFSAELLARIPQAARGKACLCAACAEANASSAAWRHRQRRMDELELPLDTIKVVAASAY